MEDLDAARVSIRDLSWYQSGAIGDKNTVNLGTCVAAVEPPPSPPPSPTDCLKNQPTSLTDLPKHPCGPCRKDEQIRGARTPSHDPECQRLGEEKKTPEKNKTKGVFFFLSGPTLF